MNNICLDLLDLINDLEKYLKDASIIKNEISWDYFESRLHELTCISKIYPSTFVNNLPSFGIIYKNNLQKNIGVGYSMGNIDQWDLSNYNSKYNDIYKCFQGILKYISENTINDNHIYKIQNSSLIPYITYIVDNTSILEIDQHTKLYLSIFELGKVIYDKIGILDFHAKLHKINNELQFIEKKTCNSSDFENRINKICETIILDIGVSENNKNMNEKEYTFREKYINILKPYQLEMVEDFKHHTFKDKEFTLINQKLMKRLYIEWKGMAESLPLDIDGSVFIRWSCDGKSSHLYKIMIIPSSDTPYSNGCFMFDLYLPGDYPNEHPEMLFLTTGRGKVRFNPNLYNCGKVCLSLLGTWSGEKWDPSISNIYQLCVSILALIFVEEPYFNEPGYQKSIGTANGIKSSFDYNQDIRRYTIKYAMKDMLQNPPDEFKEIIYTHFKYKWENIKKEISEWVTEAEDSYTTDMNSDICEIEKILANITSK